MHLGACSCQCRVLVFAVAKGPKRQCCQCTRGQRPAHTRPNRPSRQSLGAPRRACCRSGCASQQPIQIAGGDRQPIRSRHRLDRHRRASAQSLSGWASSSRGGDVGVIDRSSSPFEGLQWGGPAGVASGGEALRWMVARSAYRGSTTITLAKTACKPDCSSLLHRDTPRSPETWQTLWRLEAAPAGPPECAHSRHLGCGSGTG
jgi:hypothetical protein